VLGAGAARLGLVGRVESEALSAILDGRRPGCEALIGVRHPARVPGFDPALPCR
jgi:hypothetical protein